MPLLHINRRELTYNSHLSHFQYSAHFSWLRIAGQLAIYTLSSLATTSQILVHALLHIPPPFCNWKKSQDWWHMHHDDTEITLSANNWSHHDLWRKLVRLQSLIAAFKLWNWGQLYISIHRDICTGLKIRTQNQDSISIYQVSSVALGQPGDEDYLMQESGILCKWLALSVCRYME